MKLTANTILGNLTLAGFGKMYDAILDHARAKAGDSNNTEYRDYIEFSDSGITYYYEQHNCSCCPNERMNYHWSYAEFDFDIPETV
jgi:hypothetical protein